MVEDQALLGVLRTKQHEVDATLGELRRAVAHMEAIVESNRALIRSLSEGKADLVFAVRTQTRVFHRHASCGYAREAYSAWMLREEATKRGLRPCTECGGR